MFSLTDLCYNGYNEIQTEFKPYDGANFTVMKKLDNVLLPTNKKFCLLVIALVFIACVSCFAVHRVYEVLLEYDDEQNLSETAMAASIVNERVNSRLIQLRALAFTPTSDKSGVTNYERLQRLRERAAEMGYLRFSITNTDGLSVTTDGKTFNVGDEPQFRRASSSFSTTSSIFQDRLTDGRGVKTDIIVMEVPMYKGANIIGTLAAAMKINEAVRLLDDIDIKYSGAGLFLIDSHSRVIACSDVDPESGIKANCSGLVYNYLSNLLSRKEQAAIAVRLHEKKDSAFLYKSRRDRLCLSFAPLSATDGWMLVSVSSNKGIRTSQMSIMLRFVIAVLTLILVLVLIMAYLYVMHWKYLRILKFTRVFMDSTSVYPLSITSGGDVRYCEDDFRRFLGLPAEKGPFNFRELMNENQTVFPLDSLKAGDSVRIMLRKKSGGRAMYLMIEVLEDGREGPVSALAIDVTGDELTQEKLLALAYKDRTTGLPNGDSLALKVEEMSARCREKPFSCACLFIDVTDSHRIVEIFSEGAYKNMLVEAADRLRPIADEFSAPLYHVKRDEFVMVLESYCDRATPEYVCSRVRKAFAMPFSSADSRFGINCRTGIVICSEYERGEPVSAGDMFRYGEIALARAKGAQDCSFTLDDESYDAAARQIELEYDLSQALKREELLLYYQPIYNAARDTITGAEALLRWKSKKHGMVPPDKFIPMAEKNGYIVGIGDFVIRSSLAAAARFQDLGVTLEFNVSSVQLMQVNFAEDLVSKFQRSGVRRGSVGIEITESCFLSDADNVGCKLAAIRKAGLNVLIDDFGSGYSSLSYLRDIPANYLKIDKSFISGIDTSESLKAIVSGTCSVGRAVGMKIIAEGVETPGQLEAVVQCGCSLIQGFYIARPMPEEDFINFIQQFNNARKG